MKTTVKYILAAAAATLGLADASRRPSSLTRAFPFSSWMCTFIFLCSIFILFQ